MESSNEIILKLSVILDLSEADVDRTIKYIIAYGDARVREAEVERQKEENARKLLGDEAYQMVYPEKVVQEAELPKGKPFDSKAFSAAAIKARETFTDTEFAELTGQPLPATTLTDLLAEQKVTNTLLNQIREEQREGNRLLFTLIENTKSWNWEPPKYTVTTNRCLKCGEKPCTQQCYTIIPCDKTSPITLNDKRN